MNAVVKVEDQAFTPRRYEAMVNAIAACHRVDEVKELHNKARALEIYAAQAKNTDAERKACEIRIRAEHRTGELLKELARATPQQRAEKANVSLGRLCNADTNDPSPYAAALEQTGISRRTAHRYQALAEVPMAVLEESFKDPSKPTTTSILRSVEQKQQKQMPPDVLWLWGRMRDFERDGYENKDVEQLIDAMTDAMREEAKRIAPSMANFFFTMAEVFDERA